MTAAARNPPEPLPLILVVDDDAGQRQLLSSFLTARGFPVATASSGGEALERIVKDDSIAMIVSDVRMPGMTGLDMLRRLREAHSALPVLLVTAYADIRDAVEAMRDGAVNYLEKPIVLDELFESVRCSLGLRAADEGEPGFPPPDVLRGFVCESPAMRDVVREVMAVAPSPSRVLISGESGVGKDAVVELIHRMSRRADKLLARINCASTAPEQIESELFGVEPGAFDDTTVPDEGLLEHADGGTLFLDDIGDLPPAAQTRILRYIESGMYRRLGATSDRRSDARILAGTKTRLEDLVEAGHFREDLFYRLGMFELHIPPLRERRADILPLANRFLEAAGTARPRFSTSALAALESHVWPGNARELRNAMERAALLSRGDMILVEHLPRRVREHAEIRSEPNATEAPSTMDDIERSVILQTLRENRYNRSESARRLGISRRALTYKLRRFREEGYSIEPADPPAATENNLPRQ